MRNYFFGISDTGGSEEKIRVEPVRLMLWELGFLIPSEGNVQGAPKVRSPNFMRKIYFYIKFLKDVYCSIEYKIVFIRLICKIIGW